MSRALFVVSEEGYWAEECIEPLTTLEDAGVEVTVVTPSGSAPVVDERSLDPDDVGEEAAARFRDVHESHPVLRDPEPIATVEAADYDAVVFPGGHGTVWDVTQDRHARQLLLDVVAGDEGVALVVCHAVGPGGHGTVWDVTQDRHARQLLLDVVAGDEGVALVVCHAVGILAFTREADGSHLVEGRSVTGFPNAWEEGIVDEYDRLPDGRKLPYWVEDEVRLAGGEWDAELDDDTSVTVDGDLITARGPPSSAAAAATLLERL